MHYSIATVTNLKAAPGQQPWSWPSPGLVCAPHRLPRQTHCGTQRGHASLCISNNETTSNSTPDPQQETQGFMNASTNAGCARPRMHQCAQHKVKDSLTLGIITIPSPHATWYKMCQATLNHHNISAQSCGPTFPPLLSPGRPITAVAIVITGGLVAALALNAFAQRLAHRQLLSHSRLQTHASTSNQGRSST